MTCKPSIEHRVSGTIWSMLQGVWLLAHLVPCSMATAGMSMCEHIIEMPSSSGCQAA